VPPAGPGWHIVPGVSKPAAQNGAQKSVAPELGVPELRFGISKH